MTTIASSHASHVNDSSTLPMIVGGRHCAAIRREWSAVVNPATGQLVGRVPLGDAEDARGAVTCANGALDRWRQTAVEERATILEAAITAVADHAPELAVLLTREQGKPLFESVAELDGFVNRMRSFVRLARSTPDGRVPMLPSMRSDAYGNLAMPGAGVTAALVAWNFPIGLMAKKTGPVLLAGGTVIVKPAFTTPLTTLRVTALMNEAGLPPGVLNCVTGRGEDIGAALVADASIHRVHLSGSDSTGARVQHAAGRHAPQLVLDLAGSDAMIVCEDADVPKAVHAAVVGRYRNAGQACVAVKRLYVAAAIYRDVVEDLVARVALRTPGDGLIPEVPPQVRLGPLHTAGQRDQVEEQLRDAVARGATVLLGGGRPSYPSCEHGHFLTPTVVADVSPASKLVTEEVFGPVLPVFKTATVEDAVAQTNESPWGVNISVWTDDRAVVARLSRELRCHRIWFNRLPFGAEHAS